MPEVTMPPGELMYMEISFFGFSASRKSSCAADQRGDLVFDRARDKDDALLQEARINVIGPLAAVGLLDHHGHQRVQVDFGQVSHRHFEGLVRHGGPSLTMENGADAGSMGITCYMVRPTAR